MPITNLAIQRRRLHELWGLTFEKELEIFNIELTNSYYHGTKMQYGYEAFNIHARKITPANAKRLKELGFTIESVDPINDYTLKIRVHKMPPEKKI